MPANGLDRADREPEAQRRRSRLTGPVRSIPAIVWWITALHFAVLLAYSVVLPTYRSPDEPLHVDLSHLFSEELHYPAWDERNTGSGIQRSLGIVQFGSRAAHLTQEAAPRKGDRPSIEDLEAPAFGTGINQLSQHPPLYYVATGAAAWAVEAVAGDPIGDFMLETWFYRLMSVLFVAPLPLIIWRVATLLRLPRPVSVAAILVPLAIPQYLHIGSSANNDSLVLLLIWLITPVVVRVAEGALTRRTAVLAGALTGLALFTKLMAIVMPLWALAALVVAVVRLGRSHVGAVVRFGVIYGVTVVVTGGWWWIRNVVLYGEPFPSRYDQLVPPLPDAPRSVWDFADSWAFLTTRRFWGDFGWYDTHITGPAVGLASAVCVIGLAVACTRRDRVAGTPVGNRWLLAAPFVFLVAAQFSSSLQHYLDTGRLAGLQGRYWFGAIAGLAVVVSLGLANLLRRALRFLPLVVLGSVVAMQVAAMAAILGFYWGEPGSAIAARLRAVVAWAPLPGQVIGAGAAVGGVILVATVAQIVAAAVRPGEPPPPGPTPGRPTLAGSSVGIGVS